MKFAGRVIVLRYHCLEHIPVAVSQTKYLSELGYPIGVVEFGSAKRSSISDVPVLSLSCRWVSVFPKPVRAFLTWFSVLCSLVFLCLKTGKPSLFITHGIQESGLAFVLNFFFGVPYLSDVHEVYSAEEMRGTNRFFFLLEKWALKRAACLVFPESNRATLYQKRYELNQPQFTVFNCPRIRPSKRLNLIHEELELPASAKVMLYLGGVGRENFLFQGIQALGQLPETHFVLVGWGERNFLAELEEHALHCGVENRYHWLGAKRNRWEYLQSADVSYCLYGTETLRLNFAATASNKLMESIAVGVPVIALKGAGFKEVIEASQLGVCLSSPNPKEIAAGVREVLYGEDHALRGARARALHKSHLNYEAQFEPVLTHIKTHLISSSCTAN